MKEGFAPSASSSGAPVRVFGGMSKQREEPYADRRFCGR